MCGKYFLMISSGFNRSLFSGGAGFGIKRAAKSMKGYKFMVDGELWTRFFLHAPLWYASCFIGGYRMHKINRAHKFIRECRDEMRRAIEAMRRNVSPTELGYMRSGYCYLSYDHAGSVW